MESFLDEIYGPIVDYFEDDYHLAAAKLLEVCFQFYVLTRFSLHDIKNRLDFLLLKNLNSLSLV